jgi:hypothetical protein
MNLISCCLFFTWKHHRLTIWWRTRHDDTPIVVVDFEKSWRSWWVTCYERSNDVYHARLSSLVSEIKFVRVRIFSIALPIRCLTMISISWVNRSSSFWSMWSHRLDRNVVTPQSSHTTHRYFDWPLKINRVAIIVICCLVCCNDWSLLIDLLDMQMCTCRRRWVAFLLIRYVIEESKTSTTKMFRRQFTMVPTIKRFCHDNGELDCCLSCSNERLICAWEQLGHTIEWITRWYRRSNEPEETMRMTRDELVDCCLSDRQVSHRSIDRSIIIEQVRNAFKWTKNTRARRKREHNHLTLTNETIDRCLTQQGHLMNNKTVWTYLIEWKSAKKFIDRFECVRCTFIALKRTWESTVTFSHRKSLLYNGKPNSCRNVRQ